MSSRNNQSTPHKSTKKSYSREKAGPETWSPLPVPFLDDDKVIWPLLHKVGVLYVTGVVDCKEGNVEVQNDAAALLLHLCGYFGSCSSTREQSTQQLIGSFHTPDLKSYLRMECKSVHQCDRDRSNEVYGRQMKSLLQAFRKLPSKKELIASLYGSKNVPSSVQSQNTENQDERELHGTEHNIEKRLRTFVRKAEETEMPLRFYLYEAFFLSYGLGLLNVTKDGITLNLNEMWDLYSFLYKDRDVEFPIIYAAYHYYRSKGWVVKSGTRYGCHFVLYKEGPDYHHSLFAVTVIKEKEEHCRGTLNHMSWQYLLGLHRTVQGVAKDALLCFVCIPKDEETLGPESIKRFKIQSVLLKRWIPSEERDAGEF